jgi:hypothetical protein
MKNYMTTPAEAFEMGRLDFHSGLDENPFILEPVEKDWEAGWAYGAQEQNEIDAIFHDEG